MTTDQIKNDFALLLSERGVHTKLGISSGNVRALRYKLAKDIGISTDTMIALLKKSGWSESQETFTRKDLVGAVNFALKSSSSAKQHGAEYLVDKYLIKKSVT